MKSASLIVPKFFVEFRNFKRRQILKQNHFMREHSIRFCTLKERHRLRARKIVVKDFSFIQFTGNVIPTPDIYKKNNKKYADDSRAECPIKSKIFSTKGVEDAQRDSEAVESTEVTSIALA